MNEKSLVGQFEELTADAELPDVDIDIDKVGLMCIQANAVLSRPIPSKGSTRSYKPES